MASDEGERAVGHRCSGARVAESSDTQGKYDAVRYRFTDWDGSAADKLPSFDSYVSR